MENGIKMDVLSKNLMDRIRDHVNSKETSKEYGDVIGKICRYFSFQGYNEYDPCVIRQFMEDMRGKSICIGYARFIERVVRIMVNYAENGIFDFSYKPSKGQLYQVNEHHRILISDIEQESGLSDGAKKELDHIFRHLFFFVEQKGLTAEQITDDLLMEFITEEIPKTVKYTMYRPVRVVKMTASYLKSQGIANLKNDLSMLKVKGQRERIINPFTADEVNSILNTIENSDRYNLRDRAIILLAYDSGLRWCDIRDLKFEDIDWNEGTVSVIQKKTGKPVVLPLSGKTMNAIADYILNERPKCSLKEVFLSKNGTPRPMCETSNNGMLKKAILESEVTVIKGRGFHSLRRSYATEMSNAGVPLETISQMLGHKSIEEDKPYLTYNREKISFLTFDFSLVPISAGYYLEKEDV
ncbi:MAG: site-specific integrase [Oliverpabstia sp.]